MKKVIHLTSVHARYDNRILIKECSSLASNGFDVSLIVADGKGNELFNQVKIIDAGPSKNLLDRMTRIVCKVFFKAWKLDGDIYHFHDPELIPTAFLLKLKRKHVIYDIHEDYQTSIRQKRYLPSWMSKTIAFLFNFIEKAAAKIFTIILAEKYYQQEYPNGITILNYPLTSQDTPKHLQPIIHTGKASFIYTGNVTEDRGAFLHAALVRELPDVSLCCIGKCHEAIAEKMYAIAENDHSRLKLIGVVEFISPDRNEAKYKEGEWLAGLALFPRTEHYEKKELTKFFEYMKHGLPVICSDFPVWKALIEENKCGIAVDPHDMNQIRKAVDYLKAYPEEGKKMGENGRKVVQSRYNWKEEEKKLLNLYWSFKY